MENENKTKRHPKNIKVKLQVYDGTTGVLYPYSFDIPLDEYTENLMCKFAGVLGRYAKQRKKYLERRKSPPLSSPSLKNGVSRGAD